MDQCDTGGPPHITVGIPPRIDSRFTETVSGVPISDIIRQDEKQNVYIDYTQLARHFCELKAILVGDRWFTYKSGKYTLISEYKVHPMADRLNDMVTGYAESLPINSTLRTRLMKITLQEEGNALSKCDMYFRSHYPNRFFKSVGDIQNRRDGSRVIAFRNCVLEMDRSGRILAIPHSPDNINFNVLDVNYDPDCKDVHGTRRILRKMAVTE